MRHARRVVQESNVVTSARRQLKRSGINARLDLSQAAIDNHCCKWLASIVLKVTHRRGHSLSVVIKDFINRVRNDHGIAFGRQHDRIGTYRCRSVTRSNLPTRKLGDVDFFVDLSKSEHVDVLCLQRSHKSKSGAEHDLIGRLNDVHFMQHAIRRCIKDVYRALFCIDHESIATAWSKTDRASAWFS